MNVPGEIRIPIQADHRGLCQYENWDDNNFAILRDKVTELMKHTSPRPRELNQTSWERFTYACPGQTVPRPLNPAPYLSAPAGPNHWMHTESLYPSNIGARRQSPMAPPGSHFPQAHIPPPQAAYPGYRP